MQTRSTLEQVGSLQVGKNIGFRDGDHTISVDRKGRPKQSGKHEAKVKVKNGVIISLSRS